MKTFFAAFLGFLAAGMVLIVGLWVLHGFDRGRPRSARLFEWSGRDQHTVRAAQPDHKAARTQTQRRHADRNRKSDELQEQRHERLALLTATLRTNPIAQLTAAEMHLFQEHERQQARTSSDAQFLELLAPVQIDQWTTLQPGTAVEFVRADHDRAITIRHEGARYQVSPCQTQLRASRGDVCEE